MTHAAHTPAPWLCSGTSVSNPQANRPNAIICDVSGWGNRDEAEQIANARLIAAAPDLLAACEEMAAQLGGGDDYTKWEDAKAHLLAAIAKAKGN